MNHSRLDHSDPQSLHPRGPCHPSATRLYGRLAVLRSEEHTSELQSRLHLVCRLLLEKKNNHPPHAEPTRWLLACGLHHAVEPDITSPPPPPLPGQTAQHLPDAGAHPGTPPRYQPSTV